MTSDHDSSRPSIEDAYSFVAPSYDWMVRRFEAINGRLQNSVALIATVPVLSNSIMKALVPAASIESWWLIGAIFVFVFGAAIGTLALYRGGLELLDPKILREDYLDLLPSEFKKQMLEIAGEFFDSNLSSVLCRARIALGLMIAPVVGLGLLVIWAWTSI